MTIRWAAAAALLLLPVGAAAPALAQGNANEEVKRAVERAVGASIASSVAESLSRSVVSEGLRLMPTTTLFSSPFYNRTDGDFDFGSFKSDIFGGVVGALHKVHDVVLVHGAFAGATVMTTTNLNGTRTASEARSLDVRLGADLVYLNTPAVKGWLTLEGGVSNFDTNLSEDIWSWSAGPSTTVSVRAGNVLFEPSLGFAFSNTFENDNVPTTTVLATGFSLKYRGEQFRPQFNFAYTKIIDPDLNDDGFITAGPELLYAVTPAVLLGVSYSYGSPLTPGFRIDSHTFTMQLRWTF